MSIFNFLLICLNLIYTILIFNIKKSFIYFKDTYSTNLVVNQPVLYEILKNYTKFKKNTFQL